MADDGLIIRKDYKTNPPRIEYSLSNIGKELLPIIDSTETFGNYIDSL